MRHKHKGRDNVKQVHSSRPHIVKSKAIQSSEPKIKVDRVVSYKQEKEVYSPSSPTSSKTVWMTSIIFSVETRPSTLLFSLTI